MKRWFTILRKALTRPLSPVVLHSRNDGGKLRVHLKCLYPFLQRHRRTGAISALLAALSALVALPQPLIYRQFIDRVLLDRQLGLIALVLFLTLSIALCSFILENLREWYTKSFEQRVNLDIQESVYAHTLKLPTGFFHDRETGPLLSRIKGDLAAVSWFYSKTPVTLGVQLLQWVGGLALVSSLEWRLTLLVLVLVPFPPLAMHFFSRRIRDLAETHREERVRFQGEVSESFGAVELVKACAAEKRILRKVVSDLKASGDAQLEQTALSQLSRVATRFGPAAARLSTLCLGGYWVAEGKWTLGSLVAFQSYLGYIFGPSETLAGMSVPFRNARAALERLNRFFNLAPEENYDNGKHVDRLTGEVEFRDVSFSYHGQPPVIENLQLRVKPGERVAIVGPSGIGKTTLTSLILRFYRPTSGEIFFDGEPASAYEVQSLRRRIGYMAQKTILLSLPILDNLRYGNPNATVEEVRRACRIAEIDDFVQGLPERLQTVVGPRGIPVSEGQAQRLSLARALVKDPDILLLDEPTSAIDLVTERSIFESLPPVIRGKTLFIVAHRLSTIKDCSRILLLDEDHLIACGTHESLLRTEEYYRRLVEIQLGPIMPGIGEWRRGRAGSTARSHPRGLEEFS